MKTEEFKLLNFIVILILFTSIFNITLFAQKETENLEEYNVIKTKYTVLERESKSFRSFFGSKSGQISFDLIELKNLSIDETILGVEINIETSEIEKASSSIAFANVGNLWGVSSSVTYNNIQNSGYIFLDKNDLETIINFLNEIIVATGQAQEKFTLYKISIKEQFELGMVYDNKSVETNKWGFIFTTNESTYRLNYPDGIEMLRSLSKYYNYIKENQSE